MITGLKSFQRWFQGYDEQYTIIGGTACELLMIFLKQVMSIRIKVLDFHNFIGFLIHRVQNILI